MSGTHVITVKRIEEFPAIHGHRDAWEIWGPVDISKCAPRSPLVAWTYWTTDPTVADTAEIAKKTGAQLIIDWKDDAVGAVITGCELWQESERRTA